MRRPEWTEILAVIGLTVALGLLAPGRDPVLGSRPRARPSRLVARDGKVPPLPCQYSLVSLTVYAPDLPVLPEATF